MLKSLLLFDLSCELFNFSFQNSLDQAVSLALPLELFYKNTHKAYPNRWTYVEDELFISTHPQLKKDIGHCVSILQTEPLIASSSS